MAEATIQGIGGSVTFPTGFNFKAASWSGDYSIETVDTTGFDEAGFRTKEPVIMSMSGSVAGTAESGAVAPILSTLATGTTIAASTLAAAKATLTLTAFTGCTFAMTAVVTRVSMSRPADGKMDVTMDFESTGPITQTWATS